MYAKIKIEAKLEVVTGLHIGSSGAYSAIGAVDSPVIRDPFSGLPVIPGSSLKGKIRTLLARNEQATVYLNKDGKKDSEVICRLFGDQGDKGKNATKARLQFADAFLLNVADFTAVLPTEVKFENTINRFSGEATPRQIERVTRGARFGFDLIYTADEETELDEDFRRVADGLRLLQLDYLGGHGTRGYGKVRFTDLSARCVWGTLDAAATATLNELLKDVENDALSPA